MATDRDEQQRQQQELEEIRRSFAEMGARMGSLFEPAEVDDELQPSPRPALPAPPAAAPARPRWVWAGALALLFLAGTAFGWILPKGDDGSDAPPATQAPETTAKVVVPPPPSTVIKTKTSVPDECVEASELADEVISRLNRGQRDNALALALRDYSVASQACRKEASP
jgi:alkanesulfonate monooxygenase SsuD/methylene tetrahydromethanopterin reductase-like flavin-dependent oxidoreductase (luciferase family)